jgi:hypothetical protein
MYSGASGPAYQLNNGSLSLCDNIQKTTESLDMDEDGSVALLYIHPLLLLLIDSFSP